MNEVIEDVLEEKMEESLLKISGDIEALLLEQREGIIYALKKISKGVKMTIGIDFDHPNPNTLICTFKGNYPLEPKPDAQIKRTFEKKVVIKFNQDDLPFEEQGGSYA